ncbi:MAG: hypothetical protein AAFX94_01655 [Myxococcota bacterium]
MSNNDDLQSFKIGDTRKPGVGKPTAPKRSRQQEQMHEEASAGFDRIERILEDEDPERVSDALTSLHQKVSEYLDRATTNREKATAKKALASVERTADLMNYLFQTKEAMETGDE